MKEFFRQRFPRAFVLARRAKDRLVIEARVLRNVRMREVVAWLLPRRDLWTQELPLQRPLERAWPPGCTTPVELAARLRGAGRAVGEGGHVVYLPPDTWRNSPLSSLAAGYPADAGLKVVRNSGDIETGAYLHGGHHSRLQGALTYGHRYLPLVVNRIHTLGFGPRLYDQFVLRGADRTAWVAYVIQHVAGRVPTADECARGIAALSQACDDGELALVAEGGFADADFACPECRGNAFVDASGRFQYVDFQNFVLPRYGRYLTTLAKRAAATSHFGDKSVIRGGAYLYQSVPGTGLPAKRNPARRMPTIRGLFADAGLSLTDRVVLDVGCNMGMMLGQYLANGASWAHGWDRPPVVGEAMQLLLALGCTRFTLTGCELTRDRMLEKDVPPFLRDRLDGCVVSYLAVRGHIAWLDSLRSLPWACLIYEGHEGEDEDASRKYLAELQAITPCTVRGLTTYRDGDSDPRVIALVVR